MFKSLIPAVVIVSALAAPTFAFAQSTDNGPLTRAEVKAQLVQLEKAGYNPAGDQVNYPPNIQAAQARVDAQNVRQQRRMVLRPAAPRQQAFAARLRRRKTLQVRCSSVTNRIELTLRSLKWT